MKAPHSLKNWLDCEDVNCRCNAYLAALPEIPTNRSFTMRLNQTRNKRNTADRPHPSAKSYNLGCRCVKCRDFNAKRLESYRPPLRKRRVSRV